MSTETILELEYLLRVLIAAICGCLIGYERKSRNKEAGIRTHMLVSFGAALIMVVSKYAFFDMPGQADVSRIAAQVVSGVGFLGAGIIFVRNETVNGLTTAAGIWVTAGIGMSIGSGMYVFGVLGTLCMLLLQILSHTHLFYHHVNEHGYLEIKVENSAAIPDVDTLLERLGVNVYSSAIDKQKDQAVNMRLEVEFPKDCDRQKLMHKLTQQDYILRCKY